MIPIPKSRLEEVLKPILEQRLQEANLGGRTSVEYIQENVKRGYDTREISCFVDDLENPKSFLACGVYLNAFIDQLFAGAFLIWVDPSIRKSKQGYRCLKELVQTLEDYAKMQNADVVTLAEWHYLTGPSDVGKTWGKFEYDKQETTYIKLLNTD